MYALGIDLGTTYTAAAVWRDGHAEIASLGGHSAAIPSMVLLRPDGTFLTGESAGRRGLSEPQRVAREFKRRLGDPTPILLGGVPHSAESLTARLLRAVIDAVSAREGREPDTICVTHPASWGPYETGLMHQVIRIAGVEQPVRLLTEPQAAAVFYARRQRLEPGAAVAVYDLGGATFDAAVLRATGDGFALIGRPEGIERLGGADFDAAIFAHVAGALDGALDRLDERDPAVLAAVARLREECVRAKEALSAGTDATIPVLLPDLSTEVRLTRSELEAMTRPVLHGSIEALRRAVRSAGVEPAALHSVLLVGGSSRIPLVARMVGSELGRPVAVGAHPEHTVALGAAWQASHTLTAAASSTAPPPPIPSARRAGALPPTPPRTPAWPGAASLPAPELPAAVDPWAADAAPFPQSSEAATPPSPSPATMPMSSGWVASASSAWASRTPPAWAGSVASSAPTTPSIGGGRGRAGGDGPRARTTAGTPTSRTVFAAWQPSPRLTAIPASAGRRSHPALLPLAVAAMAAILTGAGAAVAVTLAEDERSDGARTGALHRGHRTSAGMGPNPAVTEALRAPKAVPADEQCTDEMKRSTRWVCLTRATIRDGRFTLWYEAEWSGTAADTETGFHLHIYGGDGRYPDEASMGGQAAGHGHYFPDDEEPSVRRAGDGDFEMVSAAAKVCARISRSGHGLEKAADGSYHTGNCIPIDR